ncbi:rod shape-determining protein RodA [Candidatus Gottesmanbacteria bacterium]|nr:rod shape-determining protein RodA [Candidatus Gottesmanbacteria bacterium]
MKPNRIFGISRASMNIDWILFFALLPLIFFGLVTMSSFTGENYLAIKQIIWVSISLAIFFMFSVIDWRFLKRSDLLVSLFILSCTILAALFLARSIKGAKSWFDLGSVSLQPADFVKIVVILILAKYFSRRHIEIANVKHIFISGIYAFIPFVLILLQPALGSAMIIFFIWIGMVTVSGVSKKHLLAVFVIGLICFAVLWGTVLKRYQKDRILTFIDPFQDIKGAGYNAFQSQIAVGSGELFGKGIGYGTQSRLKFLPEYQTDFIFAAFAEEWGFFGVVFLLFFFGVVIWRILYNSLRGASNFETLFGVGLAVFLMSHFTINVGMNMGLLPVTGITLPFVSYGGSHLLTEFAGLGILMGMRKYSRATHRDNMKNEFFGPI